MNENKLWTKSYIFLLVVGTLTSISFYQIVPILVKYATSIGAALTIAGIISGLFSITALVARPFSGYIADRLNKKKLMIISIILLAIAILGYSFSSTVGMLIFFRVIHGVAFAINGTTIIAIMAQNVPNKRLGEGIGYFGLAQIIATAIGPNIGIFLSDNYGYKTAFIFSAFILLGALMLMPTIPFEKDKESKNTQKKRKEKIQLSNLISTKLIPLAIIGGVFSMMNGIIGSYLVLVGDNRSINNIGLYFTVNAIALVIIRPFAGKMSDRKGLSFILYPAIICEIIAVVLLGRSTCLFMILIAAVFKALGQGSAQPTLQSTCIKLLPKDKAGVATSTFYIGADVGQGLGPIIGGAIASMFGYKEMFYFGAFLLSLSVIGYFLYSKYKLKENES